MGPFLFSNSHQVQPQGAPLSVISTVEFECAYVGLRASVRNLKSMQTLALQPGVIDSGRALGMALDTIARLVREAPLHSLTIAFLLGMVVARRR
jgi:hypothetical protein